MNISNQFMDINALKPNKLQNITSDNITNKNLRKVCDDFESFFMNQLLEISLKTTKLAGDGVGSEIIKGMYTDALSQKSSGSLGISDMLYTFLNKNKK
jgi:Rod binding domain-containing protein